MKPYTVISFLCLVFLCNIAFGQTTIATAVKKMFQDQKTVYKTKSRSIRSSYKTLTSNIDNIQRALLSNLQFLDSITLRDKSTVNIFEGYEPNSGNIYGVLWWGAEYYEFSVQGNMHVAKKPFDALSADNKKVVSSFSNWHLSIFKHSEYDTTMRYRGNDVCQVYLASKYNPTLKSKVKSIGFYY